MVKVPQNGDNTGFFFFHNAFRREITRLIFEEDFGPIFPLKGGIPRVFKSVFGYNSLKWGGYISAQ